jgi:hypothetical protein
MTAETGQNSKSGIDAGLWGVIPMSRRHPESGSPKEDTQLMGSLVGAICTGRVWLRGRGQSRILGQRNPAKQQNPKDKTTRLGQPYPSVARCCLLLSVTRVDITTL